MGNDEEKEINEDRITGKELLEKLGIFSFWSPDNEKHEIVRESELLTNENKIKILNMTHGGWFIWENIGMFPSFIGQNKIFFNFKSSFYNFLF